MQVIRPSSLVLTSPPHFSHTAPAGAVLMVASLVQTYLASMPTRIGAAASLLGR